MTPEQQGAVARFAKQHGRHWKSALRRTWERGVTTDDDGALLRQVRNELGPKWLAKAKAPSLP